MMIDPNDSAAVQVEKQAKIIEALMRRASGQKGLDFSAFNAFQSALELQERVDAQSRDLARATTELESARFERERIRKSLIEALESMEEGLALFYDGHLEICNELFRHLLPDVTASLLPGLEIANFFHKMSESQYLVSADERPATEMLNALQFDQYGSSHAIILELTHDRWYQLGIQRTSPAYVVLLLTEITSVVRRNKTERAHLIDRQSDYLQAVFQNSSSGICTFSASGEIKMLNGRFRELLGVPFTVAQEGASLEKLFEYITGRGLISEKTPFLASDWRKTLLRKGRLAVRVRRTNDVTLDLQANMLPDGGFLVEMKDVTPETRLTETLERRVDERTAELTEANERLTEQYETQARVEEQLRVAIERAEEAVSSKTRFLAAASHDLLQPINAAKLLIFSLREAAKGTGLASLTERLEKAFGSSEYLLRSLLDISRLESSDPDAINQVNVRLGRILESVYSDQSIIAGEKGVHLSFVPTTAIVFSDPIYLLRSVQNLVSNAVQYTDVGGRVLFGCRRVGNKIVLEVWDTGIGVAKKDQRRIFEEFARGDHSNEVSGVGLGLSIVERTCRHLGHKVWMRSALGKGSVFCLEMESVGFAPLQENVHQFSSADHVETFEHIILVIENDADVLFATTTQLESWGGSVLAASSTQEARGLVADLGMPPDIILADFQLDGNDRGTDAITTLRTETGVHIPAILITANQSKELRQIGTRNDITVMTKPVDVARLKSNIFRKIQGGPGGEAESDIDLHATQTKVDNDSDNDTRNHPAGGAPE